MNCASRLTPGAALTGFALATHRRGRRHYPPPAGQGVVLQVGHWAPAAEPESQAEAHYNGTGRIHRLPPMTAVYWVAEEAVPWATP